MKNILCSRTMFEYIISGQAGQTVVHSQGEDNVMIKNLQDGDH